MKDSDAPALVLAGTTTPEQITTKNTWNTKNLISRLGTDFVSAASAASMVAPIIAIIDRSVNAMPLALSPPFITYTTSLRHADIAKLQTPNPPPPKKK